MPTGHSSGGGSSHTGGGIGGGSSHGIGNSSRMWHGRPMPHGPGIVIINNRPYRMSGGASAGFFITMFLVFIFIFAAMGGGIMMGSASSTKNTISYDFIRYQDLVRMASNHEDRIVEGEIKSIEPGYGKFRVIYEFNYGREEIEGYSFYVYTKEKLDQLGYDVGEEIELALDMSYTIGGEPDSVPTDIVNFDVTDDGEYISANRSFTVGIVLLVGGIALTVACFIASSMIKKKFAKPYEEEANPTTTASTSNQTPKDEAVYCQYCGARINKDDRKCPECGAKNNQ